MTFGAYVEGQSATVPYHLMDELKTDWYGGAVHPARSGVYEVEREIQIRHCADGVNTFPERPVGFRYFDGERWYYGGETPEKAMFAFQTLGIILNDCPRWRGLTERAA